jgi:hypothetical protein
MGVCGTDREIAGSIIVGRIRSFEAVCGRVTVLSVCVTPCNYGYCPLAATLDSARTPPRSDGGT